jgi:hypothetical protein
VSPPLAGLNDAAAGGFEPPDATIAAGPGFVVEVANLAARVWRTGGSAAQQLVTEPLSTIFRAGSDRLTDPRLLYDASSARWYASISDEDRNSVLLAVSRTADPTGAWSVYAYLANGCADQPRLGLSDAVVVLAADVFTDCNGGFSPAIGAELWIVSKQDLVAGAASPAFSSYGPDHAFSSFTPVQSLSSTPTEYVVSVDEPTSRVVHLFSVDGVPPAPVHVQAVAALALPPLQQPPQGLQPVAGGFGRVPGIATNDVRVLDAVWENGKLWFSANSGCVPAGDSALRSCARIAELTTATPAVDWSSDLGQQNASLYFPALRPDPSGNLVVVYGESSSGIAPELVVQARTVDGTFTAPVIVADGSGPVLGGRYGDYFGAARDPSNPSTIWVAGETGTDIAGGRGWSTAVASVVVNGAPAAPPTVSTSPPPRLRARAANGRPGAAVKLAFDVLDEGTGVRVQVVVSRSTSVVFHTTTLAATLHAQHSYTVTWRPAKSLHGSLRFCVRSVATDGTRSAQSCAALTLR